MTTEDNELLETKCRKITVEEQQQEFSSYFGFQSETIWDEYDIETELPPSDSNRKFSDMIRTLIQMPKVFCLEKSI